MSTPRPISTGSALFLLLLGLTGWLLFIPNAIAAGHTARQVRLAWNANTESNLAGYRVFYRRIWESYLYTPAWQGKENTCTIPGLAEDTSYAFVVRAYNTSGKESGNSNEVYLQAVYPSIADPTPPTAIAPQNGGTDLFLTPVLQTSAFSSPDTRDQHLRTQWQIHDSKGVLLLDMTSEIHLTELDVPPFLLEEKSRYHWTARYYGTRGSISRWSRPSVFTTGKFTASNSGGGEPTLRRSVDSVTGHGKITIRSTNSNGILAITAMEATDPVVFGDATLSPFEMPVGMVSFKLKVAEPGAIVTVWIDLPEPASQEARWVKYDDANGWQDFSAHAVFSEDRRTVKIELQDGGFGDADGVANGIILDPSGVGTAAQSTTSDTTASVNVSASSGGGGGGCFISGLWR